MVLNSSVTIIFSRTELIVNCDFISESIQDSRSERLAEVETTHDPTKVEKLRLKENVLERNLSPSLQKK